MSIFQEKYVSKFLFNTKEGAERNLDQIRMIYSAENGWREIKGYVEKVEDEFRAVRIQEKIITDVPDMV